MNIMQEYKDAAWLLFGLGGYKEVGPVISAEDGRWHPAIAVVPRGKLDDDTTQYLVNINWPLLDKLVEHEKKEGER